MSCQCLVFNQQDKSIIQVCLGASLESGSARFTGDHHGMQEGALELGEAPQVRDQDAIEYMYSRQPKPLNLVAVQGCLALVKVSTCFCIGQTSMVSSRMIKVTPLVKSWQHASDGSLKGAYHVRHGKHRPT